MNDVTTIERAATRFERICSALDHLIFRKPDLDAVVRGWQVRRDRPFHRTYRDPRWDAIADCRGCRGAGSVGARSCPTCDGRGTVRRVGDEIVGAR